MAFSEEVVHSPAVSHYKTVEAPLLSEDLDKKLVTSAARLAFICIVRAHNLLYISSFHKTLESIEICLVEITPRYFLDIEHMALILRTAMDREMLQTCMELVILLVRIALEAVHYGTSHHCGQIWILSICLLATSPTRVTEDVDVRSPDGKTMITAHAFFITSDAELDSLLGRSDVEHLFEKFIIPARRHSDSLREHSRETVTCRTMKGFVPPIVLADAELRDLRRIIVHEHDLLLHGKSSEKVFCSFLRSQRRILIRVCLSGCCQSSRQ